MAWRSSGSLSRALISSVRSSSLRSSPSLPWLRPPSLTARPRLQSRRLSFSTSRKLGELGCTQSLLPMHSIMGATCPTSHLCVSARAFCELSASFLMEGMEKMGDARGHSIIGKPEIVTTFVLE